MLRRDTRVPAPRSDVAPQPLGVVHRVNALSQVVTVPSRALWDDFDVVGEAGHPITALQVQDVPNAPRAPQMLTSKPEVVLVRPRHHIDVHDTCTDPRRDVPIVVCPTPTSVRCNVITKA